MLCHFFSCSLFHPQAIFSGKKQASAIVQWQLPLSPIAQNTAIGCGAWQKWSYRIKWGSNCENTSSSERHIVDNINNTHYRIVPLQSACRYSFTVQAYSSSGTSVWSQPFYGSTFLTLDKGDEPQLVWSNRNAVFESDFDGESLKHLHLNNVLFIAAYDTTVLFCSDQRRIRRYNNSEISTIF